MDKSTVSPFFDSRCIYVSRLWELSRYHIEGYDAAGQVLDVFMSSVDDLGDFLAIKEFLIDP